MIVDAAAFFAEMVYRITDFRLARRATLLRNAPFRFATAAFRYRPTLKKRAPRDRDRQRRIGGCNRPKGTERNRVIRTVIDNH